MLFHQFFANTLSKDEYAMNLIRGVIAEIEGVDASEINIQIAIMQAGKAPSLISEIEKMI